MRERAILETCCFNTALFWFVEGHYVRRDDGRWKRDGENKFANLKQSSRSSNLGFGIYDVLYIITESY